ncbi:hypothetical protein PISMIDRAFT_676288 [Pisolithus microcarpus 441]|uniref:Uncharacterized protein n=1 Tax=Pisolithus microcarpus 441 TaxID=765257 RepID=A0A0C9ZJM6_9AGAM|nr:hypothetical protein PISMIDRAFT_676288 [Pisolithus microcarpus 441]
MLKSCSLHDSIRASHVKIANASQHRAGCNVMFPVTSPHFDGRLHKGTSSRASMRSDFFLSPCSFFHESALTWGD